jgi:hypothetical protein
MAYITVNRAPFSDPVGHGGSQAFEFCNSKTMSLAAVFMKFARRI